MINFNLRCQKDHEFEAWFRSSEAFENQAQKGHVSCPFCGSKKVNKALMAPAVSAKSSGKRDSAAGAYKALKALREHVEANCENVGDNFAEEARKIHYGEVEKREIYGQATDQEASALTDEGVEFSRIPWVKLPVKSNNHCRLPLPDNRWTGIWRSRLLPIAVSGNSSNGAIIGASCS